MAKSEIAKRYDDAIDSFVEKVKDDPNVVAVVVYGSVSHGAVWEKSDIDMMVIVRDQKLNRTEYGIYEDNILINVELCQRSELRRWLDKSLSGSFGHSIAATTKVIFTKDDSLHELFEENKRVGQADIDKTIFYKVDWLLGTMEKIEKWLVVKNDPTYARYYVLRAADLIAQIEVCSHCKVPTREAILEATKLNPALIDKFYHKPMSGSMTEQEIYALLKDMESYIMTHYEAIASVADDFFGDGEIKTGTAISVHFNSTMHELHSILDFLCDKGYLEKISQTMRLTPKSKPAVEEMAFIKAN